MPETAIVSAHQGTQNPFPIYIPLHVATMRNLFKPNRCHSPGANSIIILPSLKPVNYCVDRELISLPKYIALANSRLVPYQKPRKLTSSAKFTIRPDPTEAT